MATVRLVPSAYQLSNTTYLSITDAGNMYTNTDSTTYATITNKQTGTSNYYLYLKGFNFSDIPSVAIINSFTVKLKIKEGGGVTTSSSTYLTLSNNTTAVNGTPSSGMSTSEKTITFTTTLGWDTVKGYGSNFGIRVNCRRSNRNTQANFYVYGAEILVDYTLPTRTVTSSLTKPSGSSSYIDPNGATTLDDGENYELTIYPLNGEKLKSATDNGTDIMGSLVSHDIPSGGTATSVIKTYALNSGSLNSSSAQYFQNAVNNGADTSQKQTGNGYSSSSGTTATIKYTFDLSEIPSNATITAVRCRVKGHAESSSQSTEHCDCQLYSGTTAKGSMSSFKSTGTTNTVLTLSTGSWTRAEIDNLWLSVIVGYYGGAIDGATVEVDYDVPGGGGIYYTYSLSNVTANHTIAIAIGAAATMYVKLSGAWVACSKVYKKINGTWVEQTSLEGLFNTTDEYEKAN